MRDTKFFQIYRQLTITDVNRFDKFIRSPYFNVNPNHTRLTEIFESIYKEETLEFSKEATWRELYHGEPYSDARLRKLISELLKLLQKFFAVEELEQKRILKAQLLMEAANKRRIKKLINTSIEESVQAVSRSINKSSELYLFKYQIEKNTFYLKEGDFDVSNKDIELISANLDKFFIAEKLKYYCDILGREYLANMSYKFDFIQEIIDHIKEENLAEDLIIEIYYLISKILTNNYTRDDYFKLKELILSNYLNFEGIEQQELFGAVLNHCIRQINLGNLEYRDEMVDIYDFIFRKGIMLGANYITPFKFNNVITTFLRSRKFDIAETFINEYQNLIPASQRKYIISFSRAQLDFYRKNYGRVIEELQEMEYPDIITNLRSRLLLLVTYFELNQQDAFMNLAESFRVFLTRSSKKVTKKIITPYFNFINASRKLMLMDAGDNKEGEKIEREITKMSKTLINEDWLREKLAERLDKNI